MFHLLHKRFDFLTRKVVILLLHMCIDLLVFSSWPRRVKNCNGLVVTSKDVLTIRAEADNIGSCHLEGGKVTEGPQE